MKTFEKDFNLLLKNMNKAFSLNHFSVDIRIQKEILRNLRKSNYKLKQLQKNLTLDKDIPDNFINFLYFNYCLSSSLLKSLEMWIEVKNQNFQKAWSLLIDSQDFLDFSIKVKNIYEENLDIQIKENKATLKFATDEELEEYNSNLKSIEKSIFGEIGLYISPSFIIDSGYCSICNNRIENCDHIEGYLYRGQFCKRVRCNLLGANHFALVKNPADRRCIFLTIPDDNGKEIDSFTKKTVERIKK